MSLKITNLVVEIGGKLILDDIDLEVGEGEFFSLLGSSGCGKSTLLKTMAGLQPEKSGEIMMGDVKLHCLPPQKRGMVIMFQEKRLFTNMNIAENVAFALRNKKVKKADRLVAADKYLDMVQLSGFGSRRVHELSGGQQQRVALARALAAEPRVLLLDEPFSALDENLRDDMRKLVKGIHDETGLTTIMVTHDQHEALSLSDRIAIMDAGKIVQIGTPREVYANPKSLSIAEYFSDADRISGIVESGVFQAESIRFETDKPNGSYVAFVRPSAIKVDSAGAPFEVESILYRGDDYLATLRSGDVILRRAFGLGEKPAVGEHVNIRLDAAGVLLFQE